MSNTQLVFGFAGAHAALVAAYAARFERGARRSAIYRDLRAVGMSEGEAWGAALAAVPRPPRRVRV